MLQVRSFRMSLSYVPIFYSGCTSSSFRGQVIPDSVTHCDTGWDGYRYIKPKLPLPALPRLSLIAPFSVPYPLHFSKLSQTTNRKNKYRESFHWKTQRDPIYYRSGHSRGHFVSGQVADSASAAPWTKASLLGDVGLCPEDRPKWGLLRPIQGYVRFGEAFMYKGLMYKMYGCTYKTLLYNNKIHIS